MYQQVFELHAELLKALAHPRRLEIIQLLRDQELAVTDIHEMLDLPQANISQHLMILRNLQIVKTRREGKSVFYALKYPQITQACDAIRDMLIEQYKDTDVASSLTIRMNELLPVVHDPVCQMRVSPKTAGFHCHHQGKEFFFCASGCLKKFQERPQDYVSNQ